MKVINCTIKLRDLTIVNPSYEVVNVSDNIISKTCDIEVLFNTDSVIKYSYTVAGFNYDTTWEDADIFTFVEDHISKELTIS